MSAPERIWAWEIDNDGWWDTDKPDWIKEPDEYIRDDVAAAQTKAAVRAALEEAAEAIYWLTPECGNAYHKVRSMIARLDAEEPKP